FRSVAPRRTRFCGAAAEGGPPEARGMGGRGLQRLVGPAGAAPRAEGRAGGSPAAAAGPRRRSGGAPGRRGGAQRERRGGLRRRAARLDLLMPPQWHGAEARSSEGVVAAHEMNGEPVKAAWHRQWEWVTFALNGGSDDRHSPRWRPGSDPAAMVGQSPHVLLR